MITTNSRIFIPAKAGIFFWHEFHDFFHPPIFIRVFVVKEQAYLITFKIKK